MDRKSLIILLVSFVVLMAWYPLTNQLYPPKPLPARPTNGLPPAPEAPGMPGTKDSLRPAQLTPAERTDLLEPVERTAAPEPPAEEQIITLEDDEAVYTFTSLGGGIKLIELKNYPEAVGCLGRKPPTTTNGMASLNTRAPLPAFAILDEETGGRPRPYHLVKTGDVVRAETQLPSGLHLVKEFRLSTNYLVEARVRYENRTTNAVRLLERELVIGTATPMGYRDETLNLGMEWYDGSSSEKVTDAWFENRTLGCFPGTPRSLYLAGQSNVVWAAVHNQFFTMIVVPEVPADRVTGRRINLPPPTARQMELDPTASAQLFGYQTALAMGSQSLPAGTFVEQTYRMFAGPKEYRTLTRLPGNLDYVMGFEGFFGFFAKALLLSMNGIHSLGIPYGISIIVITVIIKLLFWPLTNASTRSMKRMAALQPQMKELQAKYKDDPKKMNTKLMEFMKENKVSPLGGCLPLLLQIPVFFGFYKMLQSAIELRGAGFLWTCDLSQPDTIFWIGGFPVNVFPFLMGATMLWQARITPMAPGMDPMQQQLMRYMPLMMVVFLYNFSAGLTLYWTVQNLLSIAQMKITRTNDPQPGPVKPGAAKPGTPAKPLPPPKKKK